MAWKFRHLVFSKKKWYSFKYLKLQLLQKLFLEIKQERPKKHDIIFYWDISILAIKENLDTSSTVE